VDLHRRSTAKLSAIARAFIYLFAWQLQLALSTFGANDGFSTPMVISAAAAIFRIVSIVPSELV
jgi:hypothetical protein